MSSISCSLHLPSIPDFFRRFIKMHKSNDTASTIVPAAAVPATNITNGPVSLVASPDFVTIFGLTGAGVVGSEMIKKKTRFPQF